MEGNKKPLAGPTRESHRLSQSPALFPLIALSGMSFSLLGSMLPEVSRVFGLGARGVSSLPLAQFLGDFAGLIALSFFLQRPRGLIIAGALFMAAGAAAIGLSSSLTFTVKAAFFAIGMGTAVLVTVPALIAARLAPERAARAMNLTFGFFSGGVMAAPLMAGALLGAGLSHRAIFMGLGALALLFAIVSAAARLPRPDLGSGLAWAPVKRLLTSDRRVFLPATALIAFYVAAETVPNAYLPKYLGDRFAGSDFRGAFVLALFWAAMTAGRFTIAALLNRGIPHRATVVILAGLALALLIPAAWTDHRLLAEILFAASGFFLSGIFPIVLAYAGRLEASASSAMFILAQAGGMIGAAFAGKAVGVITDLSSFSAGMTLAAPLLILVIALVPLLPGERE